MSSAFRDYMDAETRLRRAKQSAHDGERMTFFVGPSNNRLGAPRPAPDSFDCAGCGRHVWRADVAHSGVCLRCECSRLRGDDS